MFKIKLTVAALATCSLVAPSARASSPAGIVALASKVKVKKGPKGQKRVVIHGVFAERRGHRSSGAPKQGTTSRITTVRKGAMYFVCPAGKGKVCAREWADIKKSVGKGKCVMFGKLDPRASGHSSARVIAKGKKLGKPVKYPINMGVMPFTARCKALKRAAKAK